MWFLRALVLGALLASTGPASADDRRDWTRTTSVHIAQFLRYPRAENRLGWAGRAMVRFKVNREGHVRDVVIAASSGRPALDRAAIAAVRAANPVPAPAWLAPGDSIGVTLPVSFRPRLDPATPVAVDRGAPAP